MTFQGGSALVEAEFERFRRMRQVIVEHVPISLNGLRLAGYVA
jgi:hypothetical protein